MLASMFAKAFHCHLCCFLARGQKEGLLGCEGQVQLLLELMPELSSHHDQGGGCLDRISLRHCGCGIIHMEGQSGVTTSPDLHLPDCSDGVASQLEGGER